MKRNKVQNMGKLVRQVAAEKGLKAPDLALLLKQSPSSVNRMFRSPFLHEKLLLRLCNALEYDFFAHLCQCPRESVEAVKGEVVKLEGRIGELEKENEVLKKENGMLEKMVRLLEKG